MRFTFLNINLSAIFLYLQFSHSNLFFIWNLKLLYRRMRTQSTDHHTFNETHIRQYF